MGPTNSGKTHAALQALKSAGTGVYCGPLRLLAWEVRHSYAAVTLTWAGVLSSLYIHEANGSSKPSQMTWAPGAEGPLLRVLWAFSGLTYRYTGLL